MENIDTQVIIQNTLNEINNIMCSKYITNDNKSNINDDFKELLNTLVKNKLCIDNIDTLVMILTLYNKLITQCKEQTVYSIDYCENIIQCNIRYIIDNIYDERVIECIKNVSITISNELKHNLDCAMITENYIIHEMFNYLRQAFKYVIVEEEQYKHIINIVTHVINSDMLQDTPINLKVIREILRYSIDDASDMTYAKMIEYNKQYLSLLKFVKSYYICYNKIHNVYNTIISTYDNKDHNKELLINILLHIMKLQKHMVDNKYGDKENIKDYVITTNEIIRTAFEIMHIHINYNKAYDKICSSFSSSKSDRIHQSLSCKLDKVTKDELNKDSDILSYGIDILYYLNLEYADECYYLDVLINYVETLLRFISVNKYFEDLINYLFITEDYLNNITTQLDHDKNKKLHPKVLIEVLKKVLDILACYEIDNQTADNIFMVGRILREYKDHFINDTKEYDYIHWYNTAIDFYIETVIREFGELIYDEDKDIESYKF